MSVTWISAVLKRLVASRAGDRCEYCRIPAQLTLLGMAVDHVIAEKHGGLTDEANLALSCVPCNLHKGTDIASMNPPDTAIVRLFNPRTDKWNEHFRFLDGRIEGLTPEGIVTARLLQFNRPDRVAERRLWWELKQFQPGAW